MTTSVIKTESGEAEGSQLHDELRKIDATLHIAKRTRRNAMNYLINKTRHGWDDDILENTVSLISSKILSEQIRHFSCPLPYHAQRW